MARGRRALDAATIRMPAVTASGTCCTSGAATRMTSTTNAPANTDDQRVRAPALMSRAVAWMEPPTMPPPKKPEKRLATPWPAKSRLGSPRLPSALGTVRLMPAPCTRPMIVSDTAGSNRDGTRARSGSSGKGRLLGMGAMSPTTATDERWSTATATVRTARAIAMAKSLTRVLRRARTSATVVKPMIVVDTSSRPRWSRVSAAFATLLS